MREGVRAPYALCQQRRNGCNRRKAVWMSTFHRCVHQSNWKESKNRRQATLKSGNIRTRWNRNKYTRRDCSRTRWNRNTQDAYLSVALIFVPAMSFRHTLLKLFVECVGIVQLRLQSRQLQPWARTTVLFSHMCDCSCTLLCRTCRTCETAEVRPVCRQRLAAPAAHELLLRRYRVRAKPPMDRITHSIGQLNLLLLPLPAKAAFPVGWSQGLSGHKLTVRLQTAFRQDVHTAKPSAFLLLEVSSIGAPVHNGSSVGQHRFTSAIAAVAVRVTRVARVTGIATGA